MPLTKLPENPQRPCRADQMGRRIDLHQLMILLERPILSRHPGLLLFLRDSVKSDPAREAHR